MTPAAIRAAEGPALDAFVLERVCGWSGKGTFYAWADRKARTAPLVMFTSDGTPRFGDYGAFVHADTGVKYHCGSPSGLFACAPLSTDNAACWRWVVPALIAKGWELDLCNQPESKNGSVRQSWRCGLFTRDHVKYADAPTPALAIVRAAALTVAEGGE